MGRVLRLTPGFHAGVRKLGLGVTPARQALRTTVAAMIDGALPGPLDFETLIPPTRRPWVRRVPRCNLWVFYRFTAADLFVVGLTSSPPVPLEV